MIAGILVDVTCNLLERCARASLLEYASAAIFGIWQVVPDAASLISFGEASGYFIGDIQGDIAGPSFANIESDDACTRLRAGRGSPRTRSRMRAGPNQGAHQPQLSHSKQKS